ncbi:unnamed protein product [marine sediment metagenome]|uniref:Uncharacterized protein n=1 Tax=marine sediment metagenome TaxID=412755 RepID=X1GZU5_9ZZZZ
MAIPSGYKMPDLSGIDSPLLGRLVVQLLVGERSLSPEARLYRRNFIRLVDKSVRDIRNTVEHMDERIQKGEIALGKPIMLTCSQEGDRILVSDCELDFTGLAMVLEKMHEIAQHVLTIKKLKPKEQ